MLVTNLHRLRKPQKRISMAKFRDVKRLKIVEQIILVLLLAVIVPTTVCTIIVNNINQHAVRNELQYSALSISESIASNIDTFTESGRDEMDQIALALHYMHSNSDREAFLKKLLTNSKVISSIDIVKKYEKDKYKKWSDYTSFNKDKGQIEILKKIDDYSAVLAFVDAKVFEDQIFNIYKKDDRQIYVLDKYQKVIAAHNYNKKDFERVTYALPKKLVVNKAVIYGKVKNQPLAYFKISDPETLIIVNTTHHITKTTINNARYKIILALCASALFIIFIVGIYTSYLYINIRQLFKGIIALSNGNYTRKVRLLNNIFTPYETIFLALEFNKMADEINNTYKQLKHSNKELKKLDEFRSTLIDTVSHEFRTPLTSIKGYTSRLLRQDIELDEETKQKSLKIIKNQAERLSRMVEDLLVIPDIEGAKLNLIIDRVNLTDTINDAILSTKHKAERTVNIDIPQNFPDVSADNDRLEQVFINLLENAYKYSYPDTQIDVKVSQESNHAVIKISNSYDYIPPEQLHKLFGKFIRIDDKTTRTTRGTGLGLFIVKGLVKAMNGSIELNSTIENIFTVTVKLPLCD